MNGLKTHERGFTLAELLTCVAIIALLTTVSTGAMRWIDIWTLQTSSERLHTFLQTARSTALDRSMRTFVCPSNREQQCTEDWSQGVALRLDTNRNQKLDEEDELLYGMNFENKVQVQWRAFRGKNMLTFTPDGFTHSQNGRFSLCLNSDATDYRRELIVNKAGRSRLVAVEKSPGLCGPG